ncbi:MAG: hypothetical protein KGH93_03060 [Patescibacteria group bacterium]|nr:hypothetical protein [Patescibacteria group bacterium]MDE1946150.1 hypothetical protein [Patescibacteria group bacterium]
MKMPPGKAPKKVRKAWIGCLLPVVDIIKVGDETRTGKNVRRNLYRVPADKAFGLLARHDLEAVDWWKKNKPQAFKYWQTLGFPKSCLRFIPVV